MALENFTTFTEVDEGGDITITASKITYTDMLTSRVSYVYKDYGVGHFNGNFTHYFEAATTNTDNGYGPICWNLRNTVGSYDYGDKTPDSLIVKCVEEGGYTRFFLKELDNGTAYEDWGEVGSESTNFWVTVQRDESVGTYGTLYCRIYNNADRAAGHLIDTLTVTLHTSKKDFRYLFATNVITESTAVTMTGYVQNLDLNEGIGPFPTFLP